MFVTCSHHGTRQNDPLVTPVQQPGMGGIAREQGLSGARGSATHHGFDLMVDQCIHIPFLAGSSGFGMKRGSRWATATTATAAATTAITVAAAAGAIAIA